MSGDECRAKHVQHDIHTHVDFFDHSKHRKSSMRYPNNIADTHRRLGHDDDVGAVDAPVLLKVSQHRDALQGLAEPHLRGTGQG